MGFWAHVNFWIIDGTEQNKLFSKVNSEATSSLQFDAFKTESWRLSSGGNFFDNNSINGHNIESWKWKLYFFLDLKLLDLILLD